MTTDHLLHMCQVLAEIERLRDQESLRKQVGSATSISQIPHANVLAELTNILASPCFVHSIRSSGFLRFIVEETLAGRGSELKECVIGLEVFGRKNFDPGVDTIVRNNARRLRDKLREYYTRYGMYDPVIVEVPLGGYAVVFTRNPLHYGQNQEVI